MRMLTKRIPEHIGIVILMFLIMIFSVGVMIHYQTKSDANGRAILELSKYSLTKGLSKDSLKGAIIKSDTLK